MREVRCDGSRSKLQLIEDERNGLLIAKMQFLLVQSHIEKPKHSRPNHQRMWKEAAGSCGGAATKSWQVPIARGTFSTGGNGPSGGPTVRRRDLMLPSKRRQSENCQTAVWQAILSVFMKIWAAMQNDVCFNVSDLLLHSGAI